MRQSKVGLEQELCELLSVTICEELKKVVPESEVNIKILEFEVFKSLESFKGYFAPILEEHLAKMGHINFKYNPRELFPTLRLKISEGDFLLQFNVSSEFNTNHKKTLAHVSFYDNSAKCLKSRECQFDKSLQRELFKILYTRKINDLCLEKVLEIQSGKSIK